MEAIETYEHAGVQVKIMPDDSGCGDPRDADNPCTIYAYYRGYELGDEQLPSDGLPEIDCPPCKGEGWLEPDGSQCERCEGVGITQPTIHEWLKDVGAIAAMPLFVYEHSGITMRTGELIFLADGEQVKREQTDSRERFAGDSEGWDTSFCGFIIATKEGIEQCCGDDAKYREREWLTEALNMEVEEYAKYLEGEVYGYIVGEDTPFEDSCWGFLGFQYVKQEANGIAEHVAREIAEERAEREFWAARDVVTCGC